MGAQGDPYLRLAGPHGLGLGVMWAAPHRAGPASRRSLHTCAVDKAQGWPGAGRTAPTPFLLVARGHHTGLSVGWAEDEETLRGA